MSTHSLPGLRVIDHELGVALDHDRPDGATISVFAREVRAPDAEAEQRPWLVFLQGGPGFAAPRPSDDSGWIGRATQRYRVLLIDQRGTGRSTPVSARTLAVLPDDATRAEYLAHFRADAIVRDCEALRYALAGPETRWTVLGQSFGGFCLVHYLSVAPEALAGALFAGGLPPLEAPCEAVYRRTYALVAERNRAYYTRYPEDVERARRVAEHLAERDVRLPSGDRLTVRKLQLAGIHLGFSGGFETLHYLLEDTFHPGPDGPELGRPFLRGFENALSYDTNPIYALLHEACYAQGTATRWAAERVRPESPDFELRADAPLFFTGEMIYPWMFTEIGALTPTRGVAELLAAKPDWPRLYDREVLARNKVPCAAVVYADDMYVERGFSEETAGCIRGLKVWLTNEHEHNGLRAAGEAVFGRLDDLLHGRA